MTMLGIEASKGGRGDKEPIYKVKASFCRGYALCLLIAIMLAGALFFYEDPDDANRFLTASAVRARRAAQHLGHFRVTRLGQELERHLELGHDVVIVGVEPLGGCRFELVASDEYGGHIWNYHMEHKSDVPHVLKELFVMAQIK